MITSFAPREPETELASWRLRVLGGKAVGSKGSGKTLFAAWQVFNDLYHRDFGSIVVDPLGKMTEYVFQQARQSERDVWFHIAYVPMGGMEIAGEPSVFPMPFLYERFPGEPLQDRTARVNALWRRLFPEQQLAPVMGMPAIEGMTNYAGMLLAAMGNQLVPDADRMIASMATHSRGNPSPWAAKILAAVEAHPWDLAAPGRYFLEHLPAMKASDRRAETMSFTRLTDPFVLNPRLAAQYGATADKLGEILDLARRGMIVLFDCSGLPDAEKRLASTWLFLRCMELFRERSRLDAPKPVGFVVDELSYLAPKDNPLLEDDFEELYARLARNYRIMPLVTYQEVTQPSERMQGVLDQCGWSLYGSSSDPAAAKKLVSLLDEFDPKWKKDSRTAVVQKPVAGTRSDIDFWEEQVNTYFSVQEQEEMNVKRHRERPGMVFALAVADGVGAAARYKGEVDLTEIKDNHVFELVGHRADKENRAGWLCRPVAEILAEIEARMPGNEEPEDSEDSDDDPEPEPTTPEQPPSAPTPWL